MGVYTYSQGEQATAALMNAYSTNGGLVYIGQTTVTSGTNLDITSCFSATYDSYRIVMSDIRTSAGVGISLTLLSGTTPAASNWTWQSARLDYALNAWNLQKGTTDSRTQNLTIPGTSAVSAVIDITNPFLSQYTVVYCSGSDFRGPFGYMIVNTNGLLMNTTSYNGVRLYVDGAVSYSNAKAIVYGYRQA